MIRNWTLTELNAAGLASLGSVEAVLQPIEDIAAPSRTESVIGFGTGVKDSARGSEQERDGGGRGLVSGTILEAINVRH